MIHISLQNFKKPLVDISARIERKNFPKNIFSYNFGCRKKRFERFSYREFIFENSKHWEAGGLKHQLHLLSLENQDS